MPYGKPPCPDCGTEMERLGSYRNPRGYKCPACGYAKHYEDPLLSGNLEDAL